MRRLNVRFPQINECIEKSLFAVDALPRNPPLQRGELLLLQLVKGDAASLGKLGSRVEFALVFDHVQKDPGGLLSQKHWPNAGKVWDHLLICSETVPAIPFSLELLGLGETYASQAQCVLINSADEAVIAPHFRPKFQVLEAAVNARTLLQAIRNYDIVLRLSPVRTTLVSEHTRRLHDSWPADALKALYKHRCQVCAHNFMPRYGIAYADIRFIRSIDAGGSYESRNRLVICPNHNTIISASHAVFDETTLSVQYPNGLKEPLELRDHLLA